MIKIGLVSLGCAKNLVDSEMILGMFYDPEKFQIVNSIPESDVLILNTCGFIESSKQESINSIFELLEYGKKVVVTGCLVERYYDTLREQIPEVDLYVRIKDYPYMNKMIEAMFNKEISVSPMNPLNRCLATPPYQAYLRISDGCDNRCTYCAIPLIRGKFISRPKEEILKEAELLSKKNIAELVVISQDTTRYGTDLYPNYDIADLLKDLLKFNFKSIRLLYLYPDEIKDDLIKVIKDHQNVIAPYFDIPMQHASNRILASMHRRGTKELYLDLVNKIRKEIPNAIMRTTYIVGFPDESDADFNELKEFTKEIHFDHMGAFMYSREENTVSYDYENQIPSRIKADRYEELMSIQRKISYEQNKNHLNEIMNGIVVGYDNDKHEYQLRSYWNAPDDIDGNIYFKANKELKIGEFVNVKITSVFVYDLYGELVQ